ncbi:MAG TPA: hypothetical protein VF214_11245 [Edaphobacter sp.]
MMVVPRAILDLMSLGPGATVGLEMEGNRLIVDPDVKPHYTLEELLAASDYRRSRRSREEKEWVGGTRVGGELL